MLKVRTDERGSDTMSATPQTLTGWIQEPRFSALTRLRLFGVRRAVACVATALASGGIAWGWATPVAGTLHLGWLAPVAGLLVAVWIVCLISQVDAGPARR